MPQRPTPVPGDVGKRHPVITLAVGVERDLFQVWQSIRDVLAGLDFPEEAQIQIAMAAFQLAWRTLETGVGGNVEVYLGKEEAGSLLWFMVSLHAGGRGRRRGNGKPERRMGMGGNRSLAELRRIADRFEASDAGIGGGGVAAGFYLPGEPTVPLRELAASIARRLRSSEGTKKPPFPGGTEAVNRTLISSLILRQETLLERNEMLEAANQALTAELGAGGGEPGGSLRLTPAEGDGMPIARIDRGGEPADRRATTDSPGEGRSVLAPGDGVATVVWSDDLKVCGWSPSAARMFGFEEAEVRERGLPELILPVEARQELGRRLRQVVDLGTPLEDERVCVTRNGDRIVCRWEHTPWIAGAGVGGVASLVYNLTAARRARADLEEEEEKLRSRARLDSIATLADGVAHEINNPVTGIANYAQLICDSAPADSELQEFAGEISRESARISSIVDRLYTFARRGPTAKGAVLRPENVLWRVVAGIRPAVARHRIALLLDIPGNLPSVRCSDKEMESVLVNLLGNSLDALNQRHPGGGPDKRLGLIARCVEREGDPWLRLTVEDHGTGIVPLVAERMYEPFFTTKRKNQAVGLGLSTCLSIVEGHQGELRMTTRPGEFTRFVVELPGIASAGGADEPVRDDGV